MTTDGRTPLPRSLRIQGTLQLDSAPVEARLKEIEDKLAKEKKGVSWRDVSAWIFDLLKSTLPALVLAVAVYYLKDSVDQALREREVQVSAVKEMQSLFQNLQKRDITMDEAGDKAAQLAAYGRYAVPFFVNTLDVGIEYARLGAEDGLRMVAKSDPEPVCTTLQTVIRNRTHLYQWQTHESALRLLGEAGCSKACRDVASFRDGMSSLKNYQQWVRGAPDQSEYERISQRASETFEQLKRLKPGDCQ